MTKKPSFFKISCDEAALICSKSQYKESSFFEKLKLNFHILFCKYCKEYVKQNSLLSGIYKQQATLCKGSHFKMDDKDKEVLQNKLKEVNL